MTGPAAGGDRPVRVEVVVRGRVQGVGFRMFAARMAIDRGLTGWVANEPDGSVRCVAQGSRPDLEAFTRDLAAGPPGATVERLAISWSEAVDGLDRFAIRSGWHGGD
jgi:acylphosphatase